MIALREYQTDAVAAIEEAYARGITRPLISMPTGTGKTIVFAGLIRGRHEHGGRALILAHREELIEQACQKLRLVYPEAQCGVVKAERDEVDARIVVASVPTLAHARRRDRLFGGRGLFIPEPFATIVVDEAHHATADTYQRVLRRAGSMDEGGPLTVGVTATALRADGTPLGDVWQEIVYEADLLDMIRARYLCDLRGIRVLMQMDLSGVHTRAGDLATNELETALREAQAPEHCAQAYQEHAAGRTALVFTPTVDLAHETADCCQDLGIAAEAIDGSTPADQRRAVLARLHSGETAVVANCAVLTEGFDEPRISCIIVARPTKSWPLYVQMIGRGTRTYPGKKDCLIIDMVGNASRHKLISMATLLGSEAAEAMEGESVLEAVARVANEQLAIEAQGKLVAQVVDLFLTSQFTWVQSEPHHHVLSCGNAGMVHMYSKDQLASWGVWHVARDGTRSEIATELDLGYAQGVAEDYARRIGPAAAKLFSRDASWRALPPSEGQRTALGKWKQLVPATRGEASDLLTALIAQKESRHIAGV